MAVVVPKTIIISSVAGKSPAIRNVYTSMTSQTSSMTSLNMAENLLENGPRKRRRLTHLTPDERMMRRKLKNRVAAQTARDRKKERMTELEEALAEMEAENKRLQSENVSLKQQTGALANENVTLRVRLGMDDEPQGVVAGSVGERGSPGSAVSNLPLQQERIRALYKAATQYLTLLLCLSLTSSSGCSNKSQTAVTSRRPQISPSLRRKLVCLAQKAALLKQQGDPLVKWWGPQQRSWTPSKN